MAQKKHKGASREVRALLDQAIAMGCTVERRSKHYQVKVPGGGIAHVPITPSDHRSVKNCRTQLRAAGLGI